MTDYKNCISVDVYGLCHWNINQHNLNTPLIALLQYLPSSYYPMVTQKLAKIWPKISVIFGDFSSGDFYNWQIIMCSPFIICDHNITQTIPRYKFSARSPSIRLKIKEEKSQNGISELLANNLYKCIIFSSHQAIIVVIYNMELQTIYVNLEQSGQIFMSQT